jgi:hypothetical protein
MHFVVGFQSFGKKRLMALGAFGLMLELLQA